MANHMEEVARILGVELGEEFEIVMPNTNCYARAFFSFDGLRFTDYNVSDTLTWKPYVLQHLLSGLYTIKRRPWTPSYNERYYSIGPGGALEPGNWMNDFIDVALYKLGNCYSSVQEAEVNRDKWIKFYSSNNILDV